jgi:hypothetical protein
MTEFGVGIGPMSPEIIDLVVDYANEKQRELMIIASRNQVECDALGGGYVTTTELLSDRVRQRDKDGVVLVCRDHSGPFLRKEEQNLSLNEAMDLTKQSIKADIECGFDLLHIDTSACPDPYEAATELFTYAKSFNSGIMFEFGSEENVGIAVGATKYEQDCRFVSKLVHPEFVVGQTGTLVKGISQVGTFDSATANRLVEIAGYFGTRLKEHNVDYTSAQDIDVRRVMGVGAINVAPEFGFLQTRVFVQLAAQVGLYDDFLQFAELVINSGSWKKWEHPGFDDSKKILCAGHYHFGSDLYKELVAKVKVRCDYDAYLRSEVFSRLDKYAAYRA